MIKRHCLLSAAIVLVAFFLAQYAGGMPALQHGGRYALFPGLLLDILATGNVHSSSVLSLFLLLTGSWVAWSLSLLILFSFIQGLRRIRGRAPGH